MVVLVAPALIEIAGIVLLWAIAFHYDAITRPVLDFFTKRGGGWLGGAIRWIARPVTSRIDSFVKEHVAALMRGFTSNQGLLVLALDQTSEVMLRVAGTFGDMSEQIYVALHTLRHVTVPNLITAALVPIKAQLARHTSRLDDLEDLNRRVAVVFGNGLRGLPWGVAGSYVGNFAQFWNSYDHLWTQFFGFAQPKLNELFNARVPALERAVNRLETYDDYLRTQALPDIRGRIDNLETKLHDLLLDPTSYILAFLGLAMTPALNATGMRTALRNLTCRNTQTVARNICGMDELFLTELLAGGLIFGLLIDPKLVISIGKDVEGTIGFAFRAMAAV